MRNQNDLEWILDQIELGKMTREEGNIEMILCDRFRIAHKLPQNIRKQLDKAVKEGKLAHKKKDKLKPEIYYHPSFEYLANAERKRIEEEALKNLIKVTSVYCGKEKEILGENNDR